MLPTQTKENHMREIARIIGYSVGARGDMVAMQDKETLTIKFEEFCPLTRIHINPGALKLYKAYVEKTSQGWTAVELLKTMHI